MNRRLSRRRVLLGASTLSAALFASGYAIKHLFDGGRHTASGVATATATGTGTPSTTFGPIVRENQLAGTTDWEIAPGVDTHFIQGYVGQVSALPGDTVPLYVSSISAASFTVNVYRIGWYGGTGGRLVFSQSNIASPAQGYWTSTQGLVNCPTRQFDSTTKLTDANWQKTFDLPIGETWLSGVYLIKLTASNNAQSYIPLVIKDPTNSAAIVLGLPVNTYQAYNIWGGGSLYELSNQQTLQEENNLQRATKVSFNRPYDRSAGAGDFLSWDIHTVRWVEQNGFDVSYITNVDMADHPEALLSHRVFLSVGHDEYWTKSMRDGAESARDYGVSLAFFGANAAYWQARLEPDSQGHANRTLVCYKVVTSTDKNATPPSKDPLFGQQPELVTSQWRDPLLNRPENALLGLMYSSYFNFGASHPQYLPDWIVNAGSLDSLMIGTGLEPSQHITGGLLGYEYDRIWDNGYTPETLVVVAQSPVTNAYGVHETACTAYYWAASGALVFDAGTIWWGWGLSDIAPRGANQGNVLKGNAAIQRFSLNILQTMLGATGGRH